MGLSRRQSRVELRRAQRDGAKAKPYQVHQVRVIIVKYHLVGE